MVMTVEKIEKKRTTGPAVSGRSPTPKRKLWVISLPRWMFGSWK